MIRNSKFYHGVILVVLGVGLLFFGFSCSQDKKQPTSQDSPPQKISLPNPNTGLYQDQPLQKYVKQHGEKLAKQQQFKPKIELYRRMLKKDPQNQSLQKQLGMIQFYAGDFQEAQPLLKGIENTNLADADLFYALSQIAWVNKDSDQAQAYLNRALKLNPHHSQSLELSKEIKKSPTLK